MGHDGICMGTDGRGWAWMGAVGQDGSGSAQVVANGLRWACGRMKGHRGHEGARMGMKRAEEKGCVRESRGTEEDEEGY